MWTLNITGANCTITQNNFLVGSGYSGRTSIINGGKNLTVTYNFINGGGNPNSLVQPWDTTNAYASLIRMDSGTVEYNWIRNSVSDNLLIGSASGPVIYAYNLVQNSGLIAGMHGNFMQFSGGGHYEHPQVFFNTFLENAVGGSAVTNPSDGILLEAQNSPTVISNAVISNNVFIAAPVPAQGSNPGQSLSYEIACHQDPGTSNTGFRALNNYYDATGAIGFAYPSEMGSNPCADAAFSNNRDMVSGAITP